VQRQALERPALRPPTPLYAQLSDVLQRRVNAMLTGHGSGAAAMARSQAQSEVLVQAAAGRRNG
jgi:multiple sugar transport system substrate-binding protein